MSLLSILQALHDADVEDFQRRGRVNRAVQRSGERDRFLQEGRGRGKLLRRNKAWKQPRTNIGQIPRVKGFADIQHMASLSHLDVYGLSTGRRRRH